MAIEWWFLIGFGVGVALCFAVDFTRRFRQP